MRPLRNQTARTAVSSLTGGYNYLSDVKAVALTVSSTQARIVQILNGSEIVLENIYYGDSDGQVCLDLRDLVRGITSWPLPSGNDADAATPSFTANDDDFRTLTLNVKTLAGATQNTYTVKIHGYESGLKNKFSDLDYLRIPDDFKILCTLYRWANYDNNTETLKIYVIDRFGRKKLNTDRSITTGNGRSISFALTASKVVAHPGVPFQLEFETTRIYMGSQVISSVKSPVYMIEPSRFEQYAFANDFGGYDNIAMDGELRYAPSYSVETAAYEDTRIRVSSERDDIYSQNSGLLTEKSAGVLAKLLVSDHAFHLESDGSWKPIIIDEPSVSIQKDGGCQSVTFNWRYTDNS